VWKTCTRERWDSDRLFDYRCKRLSYVGSWRAYVWRVARFSPAGCILTRVSATLSDMSDDLIAVSKRSNSTS
jgi:hypothetical protein